MNIYTKLSKDYREFQQKTLIESETIEDCDKNIKESIDNPKEIDDLLRGLEDELNNTNDPEEKEVIQKEIDDLKSKLVETDTDPNATENDLPGNTVNIEEIKETDEEIIDEVIEDEKPCPIKTLNSLVEKLNGEEKPSNEEIVATINEAISLIKPEDIIDGVEEDLIEEIIEDSEVVEESETGNLFLTASSQLSDLCDKAKEIMNPDEFGDFLQGCVDHIREYGDEAGLRIENEEVVDVENTEKLTEFEVKAFKVSRLAPSVSASLIEADTDGGIKYIVGKDYDKENKTLSEAEIFDDKEDASKHFASLLGKK